MKLSEKFECVPIGKHTVENAHQTLKSCYFALFTRMNGNSPTEDNHLVTIAIIIRNDPVNVNQLQLVGTSD